MGIVPIVNPGKIYREEENLIEKINELIVKIREKNGIRPHR